MVYEINLSPTKKEDSSSEKTEFLEERWPKSTGSCVFFVEWFHWNDIHQNATGMMINDDDVILCHCLRIMSIQWESISICSTHWSKNTARFNRRGTCSVHFVTLHEVEGFQRIQDLFKTWSRWSRIWKWWVTTVTTSSGPYPGHSFHAKILGINVKWCEPTSKFVA